MSLTEKLQRAKLERDLAEGKVPSRAALRPDQAISIELPPARPPYEPPPVTEPFRADALQIDVRPTGLASVVDTPTRGPIFGGGVSASADGAANRCPSCNRLGRVDMVDLVGHRTHLTCDGCGAMWHIVDEG